MTTDAAPQPRLRHDPPDIPGYRLAEREAIPLNKLGTWSLFSVVPWGVLFLIVGIAIQRPAELAVTISLMTAVILLAILLLLMPILHEAVHGLVALMVGARPFFGIGGGYAYTSFHEPVSRRQYFAITVSPLLMLSLASVSAFALTPSGWFLYILVFAAGNAAGSIGDLWIMARIRRLPSDTLIYDLADGYAAFVRDDEFSA